MSTTITVAVYEGDDDARGAHRPEKRGGPLEFHKAVRENYRPQDLMRRARSLERTHNTSG